MSFSLLIGIGGLAAGVVIGYFLRRLIVTKKIATAEHHAEEIIREAKTKEQTLHLDAQKKAIAVIESAKDEEKQRRREIKEEQEKLIKREELFEQRMVDLEKRLEKHEEEKQHIEQIREKVTELAGKYSKELEKVAKMKSEEAKELLMKEVEKQYGEELSSRMVKLEKTNEEALERKAHEILAVAVQRCSVSHNSEITSSIIDIPSDEMKGRIIGKEGRNIKTLEKLTGVEVIIDETPNMITISSFSPIRRHLAIRSLEKLMKDGRIQPARIEETVEQTKKEIAIDIKKSGEDALYELGIMGVDPKLVQILGRLKFRTSYGQNQLLHSIEVAKIATTLAEDLGADVTVCKKGGLFHDIGKAVDQEMQGSHPQIGYDILKKFGYPEEICYQAISHHEDHPKTLEGIIVKVADSISGGRPGARRDNAEQYVQRLEELENLATSFSGVQKVYAVQAGRDLRVFVTPEEIDDLSAFKLAKEIAEKIENNLKYSGEIKVSVIRETRAVEYAR